MRGDYILEWKAYINHSHNGDGRCKILEIGKEIYRHPEGYFVVLEFQGKTGRFRESFYPNELMSIC